MTTTTEAPAYDVLDVDKLNGLLAEIGRAAKRAKVTDIDDTDQLLEAVRNLRDIERAVTVGIGSLLGELREPHPAPTFVDQRRASNEAIGKALGGKTDPGKPMPRQNVTRYLRRFGIELYPSADAD